MAVKKRCIFCRKHLRPDGTCQNPECPRYTEETVDEETAKGGVSEEMINSSER
jgi:hypothetical protein